MAGLEGYSAEQITDLAALAQSLSEDPKTRQQFLTLTKVHNPAVAIPEVDIPLQVNAMMKKGLERLEAMEKKNQTRELEDTIKSRRQAIVEQGLISKNDIPEVEKLMLERGISDHKTAAEFYKMSKKSAEPTPAGQMPSMSMPKIDLKGMGNITNWARNEANQTINELKSGRITIK